MGKGEVIKAIKKHPEVTTKELEDFLGIGLNSINRSIRSLMKDVTEELFCRELTPTEKQERYGKNVNVSVRVFWTN